MKTLPKSIEKKFTDDNLLIDPRFQDKLKQKIFKGENMAKSVNTSKNSFFTWNKIVPASAVLALVVMVGAGTYHYGFRKSESTALRAVELPTDLSGLKPIDEIRQLATIGLIDGVSIASVELEQEEGVLVYKVKYSNGTYKLFDAKSGEMVAKSDLEIDESVPADFVAGITIDTARQKAQSEFPNKTITKIELEMENSTVVYSVRFDDDSRVDVSATDGTVVSSREGGASQSGSDDNDDDSNEDSDDSVDSEDHEEEDTEDDGDRSGSNSGSGSSKPKDDSDDS